MNAQTPFDLDDYACAHGLYADEHCLECAGLPPVAKYSRRRAAWTIIGLAAASWGLCWLAFSWLGRVL